MPKKPMSGNAQRKPVKKTYGGGGGHQGRITVPKSAPKTKGAMKKAGKGKILVMGEVYEKHPSTPVLKKKPAVAPQKRKSNKRPPK